MPVALLELIAGPEHRLEEGRCDLADPAGHGGYRPMIRAASALDAERRLVAVVERRRPEGLVERELRPGGYQLIVQARCRQLDVVNLLGQPARERGGGAIDQLAD